MLLLIVTHAMQSVEPLQLLLGAGKLLWGTLGSCKELDAGNTGHPHALLGKEGSLMWVHSHITVEKKLIAMARSAGNDAKNGVKTALLFKPCLEGRQNSGF